MVQSTVQDPGVSTTWQLTTSESQPQGIQSLLSFYLPQAPGMEHGTWTYMQKKIPIHIKEKSAGGGGARL